MKTVLGPKKCLYLLPSYKKLLRINKMNMSELFCLYLALFTAVKRNYENYFFVI